MQCPACRHDIPEASRYCPSCGVRADASRAPTLTVDGTDGLLSSDALDGAQFIPGTMLSGRYRIVGLLGRGGMGEVYRADDLKLGQAVALKFLPKQLTHRADRLARFHQEVRLARQVSHPNVCRVHDIAEAGGQHFLSMEYIDGEDLASLLRRIGRLPSDKALELARQLCAGLAAAHERKVLHRDLKPANVLIDGRGRAHLVDFGLADLTEGRRGAPEIAGTPGYMAPEQLAGREVTTRTDVYALGLVLYEMFTGKRALTIDGAFLGGRPPTGEPHVRPSMHIPELDPTIERVIMRCLEPDPARRPSSAIAVAAALPGGDPLAAALAAGETPSPELVAAAGEAGTLSPATGALCFAGVLAGLLALAPLTRDDVSLIGLTNIERSPQALTERAHTALRNLGYTDSAADEANGYTTDLDYLRYIDENDRSGTRWRALASPQPPALLFWHRQSPRRLVPIGGANIVSQLNPPNTRSGMRSVTLDRTGRLVSLLAVPAQAEKAQDSGASAAPAADWNPLFVEAGLSIARFTLAQPLWIPPIFADERAAWEGTYPDRPDVPIRIEAAAARGKPVYFEIAAPWTRPRNENPVPGSTSGERIGLLIRTFLVPSVLIVAAMLAFRNVRLGRGDRRGATRLSLCLFAAGAVSNALATGDLQVLSNGPALLFIVPALAWLLYIALEPQVRRVWPETMIGWSRLLAGSIRDPLVGRDVLIGVLIAIGDGLLIGLHALARRWSGRPPSFPVGASSNPWDGIAASSNLLLGGRFALSQIIGSVMSIPLWATTMLIFLWLLVFFVLLRRRWLAIAALTLVLTALYIRFHTGWVLANTPADHFAPSVADVAVFVAVQTAVVLAAVRFGLLTILVAQCVSVLLTLLPIAIDSSVPYASSSRLIALTVIALAAYGWHTALAGRPMFGGLLRGVEPAGHA
jgi:serine/threonine-protein kinase